jgi:hypothetical protein
MEKYSNLTVSKLKDILEDRNLPKSGNKAALVKRLVDYDLKHANTIKAYNDEDELSASKESSAIDYSTMTVPELKIELKKLGLPTSGSKNVLMTRLKSFITTSEHETLVKNRDNTYYEYIKPYVEKLPNLYAVNLKSSPAKAQAVTKVWNNDAKWNAILMDLETLDSAPNRGTDGDFDISFVETINFYDDATMDPNRNMTFHPIEQVTRFIETYPYLSYIMLQTEKIMAFYILEADKYDWLSSTQLDWMAKWPVILALHAPSVEVANRLNEKYNIFSVGILPLIERAPVWLMRLILDTNPNALTGDAIEKTLNYEDYDKIKVVLDYFRRIKGASATLPRYTLDELLSLERDDLVKHILEDYSYLFNDFTLSVVLFETLKDNTQSALELKEYSLDLIEKTNRDVERFAVGQAIVSLDINTVTRILNMKQLDLDYYKHEVTQTYRRLIKSSKTNPKTVIEMIKLLDEHYNITQDIYLVIAAAISLPVLKFLVSYPPASQLLSTNGSDLLIHATSAYADKDVIEYIIKEFGPFDQSAIRFAINNTIGRPKITELLKPLLK